MSILDSRLSSLLLTFSLLGMPAYVHSDQHASFMSQELQSGTTSYNPTCNGQVERYHHVSQIKES